MQEMQVWSLGQEDPLEKKMATHSSIFAWEISWTEEPVWLQSSSVQSLSHVGLCKMQVCMLSHFSLVLLFATPWTIVCQAPLSMGFSRQEYWCGVPCPLEGDLPDPGIKPEYPASLALAGGFFTSSTTWEAGKMQLTLTSASTEILSLL